MPIVPESDFRKMLQDANTTPEILSETLKGNGHELGFDIDIFEPKPTRTTFGQRLFESLKSVPERLQRGFGSRDMREGRFETSKGFDIADLPGDIADVVGPALPIFGAIGGGIIAAPGIVTAPLGAGAGAGILETGRQAIGQTIGVEKRFGGEQEGFEFGEIGKEALFGATAEFGGKVATKAVGKALSPFKQQFNAQIARIADKFGIKLPISALSESEVVRQGEAFAAKGFTGGRVQKIITQANDDIVKVSDDVIGKIGGTEDLGLAGKAIIEGAESYKKSWTGTKRKLYEEADKIVAGRAETLGKEFINVDKTKVALDEILSTKAGARELLGEFVDVGRLEVLRKNLDKKLSIKVLSDTLDEINKMVPFGNTLVSTGDTAALKKVAATLSRDLDSHIKLVQPEIGKALGAADEFYGSGIQLLESEVGRNVARLSDSPELIVDTLLKPGKTSQARRLVELIGSTKGGEQRVKNVQAAFLRKLVDKAKTDGRVSGSKFSNSINKFGSVIDDLFDEKTAEGIREVAQLAKAVDRGQGAARGSQTAFLAKTAAFFTAIGSGNPEIAVGIAAQDVIFSRIFSTEFGRRLLTEGFEAHASRGIQTTGRGALQTGVRIPTFPQSQNDLSPSQ